jgi:hypothetical protein
LQQELQNQMSRVEEVSSTSLWLTVGGMFCLFSVYYAGERFFWSGMRSVRIPWDGGSFKFRLFIWGCLASHLASYALPALNSIPSLGQLLEPIGFLGWGMILVLGFTKRLSSMEKYLLAPAGLIVELMYRSTSGLLSTTITLGLFLSIIALRFRPRFSVILAALTLLFLVLLNPVKESYRQMVWQGEQNNASPAQRVKLLARLTIDYYTSSGFNPANEDNTTSLAKLASRVSTIVFLSCIVDMTPSLVPYWNGATYTSLLTKWIPRFLWPGKPQELTGNAFGQRYGILDGSDRSTSLNLPWIVELYANFGTWGVLLGMGMFGAFLAFLNRLFNQSHMNHVEFVYGVALLFELFYQESSFALMVGNVFLLSITLYVLLRLAAGTALGAKR